MNFNDAAEIAMRDTAEKEIHYEAYHNVNWATSLAVGGPTYGATRWATLWVTRRAIEAQASALREARNEL